MQPLRGHRSHASIRSFVTILLLTAIALQLGAARPTSPPQQPSATPLDSLSSLVSLSDPEPEVADLAASLPPIEGWVKRAGSGQAIAGAVVTLDGDAKIVADHDGYFRFEQSHLQESLDDSPASKKISLTVSAGGYSLWSLSGAKWYAGDTLRVYPRMTSFPQAPLTLNASVSYHTSFASYRSQVQNLSPSGPRPSLASVSSAPPATIRVYRTGSGVVEVVPFRDYVKHTLPNEWIPSWSSEAVKAGAMAVKTYAWYWVARGGKQVALGADVKDNVEDQVYDPNVSYASTDAAVDATYNYAMLRNGVLFQAQYCAGSYIADPAGDCPWPSPYMTQWGSAYHADMGKSWSWIIGFYYPGAVITPAPPGGGYNGTPVPQTTQSVPPTRQPTPTSAPVAYVVGQGSNYPDVFQEAYDRNGGEAVLGKPTGPVRWWLPYLSESNVLAQPFGGPQGRGDTWLLFDVLNSDPKLAQRAFLLTGEIARAYKVHEPSGPEWIGVPTSDPYISSASAGGLPSQGFFRGTLSWDGQTVAFAPWPDEHPDWKAEYFVGYQPTYAGLAPERNLPGQPAFVTRALTPNLHWPADLRAPQSMGVGQEAWSAQFTREIESAGESYDFTLAANSGARLWVDNLLAVNGWHWVGGGSERYNADLSPGAHTITVQYYNIDAAHDASLSLDFGPRSTAPATPTPGRSLLPGIGSGGSSGKVAALRVRVTWLGRDVASGGWVQPLTLQLSDAQSAQILYTAKGQTDRNGVAFFGDLPAGHFNVHVKGARSLQSARANVILEEKSVLILDMEAQLEGDLDGDNCITVDDFRVVQSMLGASAHTPGFNVLADLNNDGAVSMTDISLLRAGFDKCGDISADSAFTTMSYAPSNNLSDALLPWSEPERLNHDLSLQLVSAKSKVRPGEVVEVQVVANAGMQPVDGASFVLSYDPERLRPVDAAGKDAQGSEPGLALPAVMGNWIDKNGGLVGYAAGLLQGDVPQGRLVVATLRFRVLSGGSGPTGINFAPLASPQMQLTNGGVNLLARAEGLHITITP